MIKKYYWLAVSYGLILAKLTLAQDKTRCIGEVGPDGICLPNPLQVQSIPDLIARIIKYLTLYIAPPILTLMVLYGAFQIITAGGDPERFKTGKKTILYAAIGFGLVLIAWGLAEIIKEVLGFKS